MGEAHEKTKKKIAGNGKEGSRFKVWWCQLIRFKTLERSRDNLGIHKRIVGDAPVVSSFSSMAIGRPCALFAAIFGKQKGKADRITRAGKQIGIES